MNKLMNDENQHRPIGQGVFQPSRAPIAREMECRLRLGEAAAQQREPDATGSRH